MPTNSILFSRPLTCDVRDWLCLSSVYSRRIKSVLPCSLSIVSHVWASRFLQEDLVESNVNQSSEFIRAYIPKDSTRWMIYYTTSYRLSPLWVLSLRLDATLQMGQSSFLHCQACAAWRSIRQALQDKISPPSSSANGSIASPSSASHSKVCNDPDWPMYAWLSSSCMRVRSHSIVTQDRVLLPVSS